MNNLLRTELVRIDDHLQLAVGGEIDSLTAPQLEDSLTQLLARTDEAVLDFAEVAFLDSSGVNVLVRATQRDVTPTILIRNAPDCVVRTLEICGLADRFLDVDRSAP